jgi:hypothetical protein
MDRAANTSSTLLRPPWLHLARAGWVLVALASSLVFVASASHLLRAPLPSCTAPEASCENVAFSQEDAEVARQMGLPVPVLIAMGFAIGLVARLSLALVGAFIFWRRSDDWLALLLSASLMTVLIEGAMPVAPWAAVILPALWFFGNLLFIPLPFVFPNGRFVPGWARWVVAPLIAGLSGVGAIAPAGPVAGLLWLVYLPLAAYAMIYRYLRVSTIVERQQTKWVLVGLLGSFVVVANWLLTSNLLPPSQPSPGRLVALLAGEALYLAGYLALSACILVAVMRYRLWDVDVIINRALVYGGLTGTLALAYLGSVVLLQGIFGALAPLGGRESPLAVVASTLMIAALFSPVRRRLQAIIDRRFYRRKYDAAQTLAAFGAVARDETDLDQLAGRLVGVIDETMQPASVTLWMRASEVARRPVAD